MRRPLFAATAAAALLLSGCSASDSDAGGDEVAWSYTSGDGETYTAAEVPTRIIAEASSAKALMEFGIQPVGIWASNPIEEDVSLRGVDVSGIEVLGEEWGKIDVEKATELQPDLIVGDWWPVEKAYSGIEAGVEERSKKIADLAPVVGVSQGTSIVDLAEGYEKLAESLGADVTAAPIAANKEKFEAAVERFKQAVAAKPGLSAAAMSPADDLLYVANPQYAPELLDFQTWGLDVLNPAKPDPGFPYWENISWENADKYQPDLILWDGRSYTEAANAEWGKKQPTWFSIKAAKAGSVVAWPAYWLHTYGHFAAELDKLTEAISTVDPAVGG